ncbi:MAG: serine hydrolase [Actinomycetes bacterium]|jgi:CubicO group peptidase (beta-lactamase class C family)
MRRLFRAIRNLFIGVLAVAFLLTAFTRFVHYPNPIDSVRLALAPASKTPTLMPAHTIAPATVPIAWPTASEKMPSTVPWDSGTLSWQEFLDKSNTNAFLVIRNGVITYEYYKSGITASTQLPSYSVAKTMTSLLIGKLIGEGKIKESDTFVKFFPEYKTGTTFDKVTIQSLLDMESGVGVSDNYPTGPSGWGVGIAQMYATTDLNWFVKHNRKMFEAPDTKAEYRSVNTQLLGLIVKKVTGMRVADYFSDSIWQPIGAQYPATWNVDKVGGTEKTFCCFNASARDYARVGLAMINGGFAGSHQVISTDWLKRISTPVVTLDHQWKYGAQVWHPYEGINLALGLHGQYIFVDPDTRTVIVKLSDNPTDGDPEVETAKVLLKISRG